jgi:iron complex outermembrane receptor protein
MAEAERVIVTGSHIPTAEEVGPNPVQEITRDQIENSGERTAAEIIRQLPQSGPEGVPPANNAFGDFGPPGTASIALRGFDASSTLVLVDGRRVAPFPLGAPPSFSVSFVDLNSIPAAALDNVEVLLDSASAIYGADAIAGVVNIKFRRDYKGAEISTSYGNSLDKDSGEETESLIFGIGDNLTNITGVVDYYHRNGIFDHDRGYSQKPPSFGLSSNASPWNLQLSLAAVLAAGVPASQLPSGANVFFGHSPFLGDGLAPPTDYVYSRRTRSKYNPNAIAQMVPDSQRYGGFLSATHKIFGDQLQVYGDFSYQDVETHNVLSPTATSFFQTPGQTTLAIPPHIPGPVVDGPSYQDTGVPLGAYNPFNPFQQIISGLTRARLADFNRIADVDTEAIFATLGAKGDRLFDGNWGYDAGLRFSQVKDESDLKGVSGSKFDRILNAADPIFDPNSAQYIGTTTPYNPFGDYRRPIASNQLPIEYASITAREEDLSQLETADLNIYTTSLFELPGGGVGLAFGGQFRNESIDLEPDRSNQRGDVLGSGAEKIIHASREDYALYAEIRVPVVSSVHPLPGVRSLEFTGAGRFEDFLNNDTNVLVPKVGMRWQPFDESLTIRATWGEGFHEPSLLELFAQNAAGVNDAGSFFDPLKHQPAGEFTFLIHGNPNLQPEDSRAFTAGFVFTPRFLRNLTLSMNLYDIESTGRAFIPDIQDVLNRNAAGKSLPLEKVTRDQNGDILLVEYAYQNAGSRKARGADFGLSYQLETSYGTFTSITQATFLDSLQFAQTADLPEKELRSNGDLNAGFSAPLKWQGNSRLDWTWRGFSTGFTAYYLDGFHTDHPPGVGGATITHYVSQTWLFDVRASYSFHSPKPAAAAELPADDKQVLDQDVSPSATSTSCWRRLLDGTTLSIGCNNVFGQDPPFATNALNYPAALYDPTGRFVYVRLTKRF